MAIWPQFNHLTYAQFSWPLGRSQSTNVQAEIRPTQLVTQ